MKLLLDTQVVLWWFFDSPRLTQPAIEILEGDGNTFFVSVASFWEIWIKRKKGKLRIDPDRFIASVKKSGLEDLPITGAHAFEAGHLPLHHNDPFDRMLIAQAKVEGLELVTYEKVFKRYGIPVLRS